MEREHQIPQQISAYQFKLVGDMTLKQFFQVAAGALVALLLYSSNVHPYVKWPLIVLSFLAGVAFAFFPLEDRPLSKWMSLFLQAIYSPTLYIWRKEEKKRVYFRPDPEQASTITLPSAQVQQPPSQAAATATTAITKDFEDLEQTEQAFLSNVSKHFQESDSSQSFPAQLVQPNIQTAKMPVPQKTYIETDKSDKPQIAGPTPTADQAPIPEAIKITPYQGEKLANSKMAQFSQAAAPPIPPMKPNVIVGQVMNPEGGIVDSAILEVKDAEGRPVRALKSNKLGHFMIVTPLPDGKYQISTEKEGLNFEPVSFDAAGEVIPPIAIWAKKADKDNSPSENAGSN